MVEKIFPIKPEREKEEQIEMFEEDELVDPEKDMKKVLKMIEEEDAKRRGKKKEDKERKAV